MMELHQMIVSKEI